MVELRQRQLFVAVRLTGARQFRPHGTVLLREVDRLHQVDRLRATALLARVVNERRQQHRLQAVDVVLVHQSTVQLCRTSNKHPANQRPKLLSPVYTIQPVVKPVLKPVDNRLDVCLHDTAGRQTGSTPGLTTGCIV